MPIDFSFLDAGAPQKENPVKSDTANVSIRVDADSLLLCDGEYIEQPFKAGVITKIELPLGQHLLEFICEENPDVKVEKIVNFPKAGKSYLVIVNEFKAAQAEAGATCIIPEGVEALVSQQEFMRYYKGESKVQLPSTLKIIGDYKGNTIFGDTKRETRNKHKRQIEELRDDNEFEDASRLEKILEKEEKEKICIKHIDMSRCTKLESIGKKAFMYCYDLSKVILPNSLVEIQDYAFKCCERLQEIVIPSSVTRIGEQAFCRCGGLTSIEIPNGVKSIEWCTFFGCTSLTSVTIPNSVTSIGESAFNECSSLEKIDIPTKTRIGKYAFEKCHKLKKIKKVEPEASEGDTKLIATNEAKHKADEEEAKRLEELKTTINGHKFVDLGLPSGLKWATCNVGASSPEECGDYYAWGEVKTKSSYTEENSVNYRKHLSDISGDSTYDVARKKWGASWRIPTYEEFNELMDKCKLQEIIQGGMNGYKVTGPNGNSIFLPAAGRREESWLKHKGKHVGYWSATPSGRFGDNTFAYSLDHFFNPIVSDCSRYYGYSVRPVSK